MLRAAMAATRAFLVWWSLVVVGELVVEGGEEMGRPYPSAKKAGFRRPRMPKGKSSRVPIMRARHSAGGGRW